LIGATTGSEKKREGKVFRLGDAINVDLFSLKIAEHIRK
jgi:hypothetical protein